MKKLMVLFAAATLTAVTTAGYPGGQKEIAAETVKEVEAAATVEATTAAETGTTETTEEAAEAAAETDEGDYDIGDASGDNARNQDKIGENELLAVSFGTSHNDNRRLTIGTIRGTIEKIFPDFAIGGGLTSQIIIDHVKSWGDVAIDSISGALDRTKENDIRNLVIQPIHLMNGLEYMDLVDKMTEYSDASEKVTTGKPLLATDDDFRAMMKVITEVATRYDGSRTTICFMGHGTETDSNQVYIKVQDIFAETGYRNYYVDIVGAAPDPDDVLTAVREGSHRRVVLEPLMIVVGDHANDDMAGNEEGSWKTTFKDAGYEVTCLVDGLGGLEAIKQPSVKHTRVAADSPAK